MHDMPKKALAASLLLLQALLLVFSVSGTILSTVRADFGVELTPVNEGGKLGDGYSAQQIFTIAPDSPAERADLRNGDRLSEEVSFGIALDALPIEPKQSISVIRDGRLLISPRL
jgi:hypothetical protein